MLPPTVVSDNEMDLSLLVSLCTSSVLIISKITFDDALQGDVQCTCNLNFSTILQLCFVQFSANMKVVVYPFNVNFMISVLLGRGLWSSWQEDC